MPLEDIVGLTLRKWTAGKMGKAAMIAVFERIRDIPYGVLPELNSPTEYTRILEVNMGSCTPKHLLMCQMYRRLGLDVLYVVYPYRWAEFEKLYPPDLWKLAELMPPPDLDGNARAFYQGLNAYFQGIRNGQG